MRCQSQNATDSIFDEKQQHEAEELSVVTFSNNGLL